jgi:TonB family protein
VFAGADPAPPSGAFAMETAMPEGRIPLGHAPSPAPGAAGARRAPPPPWLWYTPGAAPPDLPAFTTADVVDDLDAPPALEVQTIYRDVVIGTKHLGLSPAGGRRRGHAGFDIGARAGVDAPVAADVIDGDTHPLIAVAGGAYVLNVTPRMKGELYAADQIYPLEDVVGQHGPAIALPPDARARLDCGATTFLLTMTPRPRALPPRRFTWRWDRDGYTLGAALGLALFLVTILAVPPEPSALSFDPFGARGRFDKVKIVPPEPPPPPPASGAKSGAAGGAPAPAHKGPSGQMGDKKAPPADRRYAIRGPKDNLDERIAKKQAEEAAAHAGVLGVLNAKQSSAIASIFSRDDSALGNATADVLGHIVGSEIGAAGGLGGLGSVGTGEGAGGTGEHTIGVGPALATMGHFGGGRGGPGWGYGDKVGGLGPHKKVVPEAMPGILVTRGVLDKEIIRRIVRRHINEVRFCYEPELAKRPSLGGRIVVAFSIAPTGRVLTSALQSSTMGNVAVESCTVQAVRRWDFPTPRGGGMVSVTYPFVLTPAGGG